MTTALTTNGKLHFNAAKHEYTLDDGTVLPSVSQIIREAGLSSFPDDGGAGNFYTDRGTKVHLACQYHDEGDLDEATLDPAIAGYLEGWKKFLKDFEVKMQGIEEMRYEPQYLFAGTIDRVLSVNGVLHILDIKTGNKYPEHRIQTAGYSRLYSVDPLPRLCVYLAGTGEYKTARYTDPKDCDVFLAALTIRNYKQSLKRKKAGAA